MKSTWKVTANSVGGGMVYGVYRLLDTSAVDHSGNRELHGDYVSDRQVAEKIAEELNRQEGDRNG